MTGNQTDAELAAARALPVFSNNGSTRTVYRRDNENVVYKVERSYYAELDINYSEYMAMTTIELPTGVFFPAVELYALDSVNVIAMEYIEGQKMADCYCISDREECTPECMTQEVFEKVKGILDDTGGHNVIVNERGIYIIDMG